MTDKYLVLQDVCGVTKYFPKDVTVTYYALENIHCVASGYIVNNEIEYEEHYTDVNLLIQRLKITMNPNSYFFRITAHLNDGSMENVDPEWLACKDKENGADPTE